MKMQSKIIKSSFQLSIIFALAFFGYFHFANAQATFFSQGAVEDFATFLANSGSPSSRTFNFISSSTGNLDTIKINGSKAGGTDYFDIRINIKNNITQEILATTTFNNSSLVSHPAHADINNSVSAFLIQGQPYGIIFTALEDNCSSNCSAVNAWYKTSDGKYFVEATGVATSTPYSRNIIQFANIISGSSYQNISNIQIQTSFATSTGGDGRYLLYISTSSPTTAYDTENGIAYNTQSLRTTTVPIQKTLWLGTTTQWFAYAYLYDADYSNVLASTTIMFYVSEEYVPPVGQNSQLRNIFPFVYFYDIQEIFENLTATSSATFPNLVLNFGPLMGSSTVFSSSSVSYFLGSGNVALFRTLEGYAIWVLFGYAIYHQAKHLFKKS